MGSNSIIEMTNDGRETLQQAFERLSDRDAFEDGHSYSGGFNMCRGVDQPTNAVMTREEAEKYAEQRIEAGWVRKWEHAEGVALASKHPAVHRDVREMTMKPVRVSAAVASRLVGDTEAMRVFVAKQLDVKTGEVVTWTPRSFSNTFTPTKWSATTRANEGKAVTRYFIVAPNDRRMPLWDNGFATQAEARAALKARLSNGTATRVGFGFGALAEAEESIIAMTRRENGDALVSGSARVTEVEVGELIVRVGTLVAKPSIDRTTRSGWLIYGVAAS